MVQKKKSVINLAEGSLFGTGPPLFKFFLKRVNAAIYNSSPTAENACRQSIQSFSRAILEALPQEWTHQSREVSDGKSRKEDKIGREALQEGWIQRQCCSFFQSPWPLSVLQLAPGIQLKYFQGDPVQHHRHTDK